MESVTKLFRVFITFDKLMKERLVHAFYWLGIILILMTFSSDFLDNVQLDIFAWFIDLFEFVVWFIFALVSLRLICEVGIALFRINDNISPDGGASETADVDPIEEARKAAEEAAKRARELSAAAVDRTKPEK